MCSALAPPKHPPANSPESPSARIRCRFLRGNPVPHRVRKATVVRQEFATEPWRSAPARGVQPSRTLCGAGSHQNFHQKLVEILEFLMEVLVRRIAAELPSQTTYSPRR